MGRGATPIESFPSETLLGVNAETGARASGEDFGSQIGERMQQLGGKISETGGTLAEIGEMQAHMQAQQYVSKSMADSKNSYDKWAADPQNYTDPKFAQNAQKMHQDMLSDLQKNAPNLVARNQIASEFREFSSERLNSAFKTQTDVMLQKGFNDHILNANTNLDTYRTNLKNPNMDAGTDLFNSFDKEMKAIENQYHQISPTMERELKDQLTSQYTYGAVNTNPDLAEKILDRGYIEGRTRHFLEDAIQTARGAQDIGAKQTALNFADGLLKQANDFPDKILKGPGADYFETHGFKPKEAGEMAARLQSKLDINKDFATIRDSVTGSDEQTLLKKQAEMYHALDALPGGDPKYDHDSMVFSRFNKFVQESQTKMHEDPVSYLTNYNKEISSASKAYAENPTQQGHDTLVGLIKQYQGPAPTGDTSGKYLNLSMHEMHILDKDTAEDIGKKINGAGPRQAGEILHNTIQQYKPDDRGIVLNDLMNHGKIPITAYAMERTFGAPFSDKLNGSLLMAKDLRESVGKQKGNTGEDLDKLLAGSAEWQKWSKVTAADNFQRQDVVEGFHSAIQTYALGMIQDGKSPKEAINGAVSDLTQWGHETVAVNGRDMQVQKNLYKGSNKDFQQAIHDSINRLDINRINLSDNTHRPIFPVALMAGHKETQNAAIRSILATKVFPNMNPDGKSFSLYCRGQENDFQLRDKNNKPITMSVDDLPTYTRKEETLAERGKRVASDKHMNIPDELYQQQIITTTNWPTK